MQLSTNRPPTAEERAAMASEVEQTIRKNAEEIRKELGGPTATDKTTADLNSLSSAMENPGLTPDTPCIITNTDGTTVHTTHGEAFKHLDAGEVQKPEFDHSEHEEKRPVVEDGPRRVGGERFLRALKYVLKACAKPKEQPDISFVVIHHDVDKKRIILGTRDGMRWHLAYIPAPEGLFLLTAALKYVHIKKAVKRLNYALECCPSMLVEIHNALQWDAHVGEDQPLSITLEKLPETPVGWEPPSYTKPTDSFNPSLINGYQSKHTTDAQSWTGGACLKRDDVDNSGRRHFLLVDTSGDELARAVVVPLGMTEGLPDSKQTEIDATLSPPGVATAKTNAAKKKTKSKTVKVSTSEGKTATVTKSKAKKEPSKKKTKSKR